MKILFAICYIFMHSTIAYCQTIDKHNSTSIDFHFNSIDNESIIGSQAIMNSYGIRLNHNFQFSRNQYIGLGIGALNISRTELTDNLMFISPSLNYIVYPIDSDDSKFEYFNNIFAMLNIISDFDTDNNLLFNGFRVRSTVGYQYDLNNNNSINVGIFYTDNFAPENNHLIRFAGIHIAYGYQHR